MAKNDPREEQLVTGKEIYRMGKITKLWDYLQGELGIDLEILTEILMDAEKAGKGSWTDEELFALIFQLRNAQERINQEPPLVIQHLLSFLEESFQKPAQTIERFRNSTRCSGAVCSVNCHDLLFHFSQGDPWSDRKVFEWCSQWYSERRYEEPLNAFFTLPLVGMFLSSNGMDEGEIATTFLMEFKGGGRLAHKAPSCLFKGSRPVSIGKKVDGRYMCADFLLLPPMPPVVAEIKVAVPHNKPKVALSAFEKDLCKCQEWLKPDAAPFIQRSFGIERFEYALAVLIDLGCVGLGDLWRSEINENEYRRRGIIVKRIVAKTQAL